MANDDKLHVVMFPWLAFGHIIPFLELSKFIAQKGHKVSFVSTPRNIDRLPKQSTDFINFVKITLPVVEQLPVNAEATMDVRTDDIHYLKKAYDGLEPELTRFLEIESPDWIIMDFSPHWLPPVAMKLGISRAAFLIINAWFLAFLGSSKEAMINGLDWTNPADFTVPPKWVSFPTKVAYKLYEANWNFGSITKLNTSGVSDIYRSGSVILGCEAIVIRHCNEFEPEWLNLVQVLHQRPVIPVGLMPPSIAQDSEDEKNESWVSIKEWLDIQLKGSVVYVALGSEVILSQEQLSELALGLELSGLPFFWVFRKPSAAGSIESDSVKLPDGFEERTHGQGIVWKAWAPQLKILGHDSVGGFLTHCGWSSIIEGLVFGHPLIMLPFLVDQGLNARVMLDKKVGIEVPRDQIDGSYTRESVAESLELVMVENDGKIFRAKAKEMSEIFGDNDLHNKYMDNFIEYLENHRRLSVQ